MIAINDEKSSNRHSSIFLPEDGSITLSNLVSNDQLLKICLTSTNENSTRIISISSYYVVCNLSKYNLKFYAFCINRNEKTKYDEVIKLLKEKSIMKSIPNNHQNTDNM